MVSGWRVVLRQSLANMEREYGATVAVDAERCVPPINGVRGANCAHERFLPLCAQDECSTTPTDGPLRCGPSPASGDYHQRTIHGDKPVKDPSVI